MDTNSPKAPRRVKSKERQRQALNYRLGGLTFDAIGEKIGVTRQAAAILVEKALADTQDEVNMAADELRKVELRRLDTAQSAIWGDVLKGDVQAVAALMRIMDRRAKYQGLDAPTRANVQVTEGDIDAIIAAELARIAAEREGDTTLPPAGNEPPDLDADGSAETAGG